METTRLSTKGQIVLPKNIRTSRAWVPGTEFTIEETADGILLRPPAVSREPISTRSRAVYGPKANRKRSRRCVPLLDAR